MSWLNDSLRARAGALAPVAERFLDGWLGQEARSFSGGADGLVALCTHMERWLGRQDVDEEAERAFVEQAGALLGLLLIDHVGDAGHAVRDGTHRLRLGRYGYFDPFAAVDRALDASDVRSALASQVQLAEAEAAAQGPISRVVRALLSALAHTRPDLAFADQFEFSLWLKPRAGGAPFELDLRRAVESTRDQGDDAVDAVARKLLAMLPGAPEVRLDFVQVRERLVPRLARAETLGELPGLHASSLTQELVVALMLEYQGRARYLRNNELAAWSITPQHAHAVALENLAARSQQARVACSETEHGPLWVARTGDGRDSARVLLHALRAELSQRVGGRVAVGIPHRDTFFACDADNPALVQELARKTAHDAARAPHRLSARVFTLVEGGLVE
jgi:Protein of unknown function (DUF1444)